MEFLVVLTAALRSYYLALLFGKTAGSTVLWSHFDNLLHFSQGWICFNNVVEVQWRSVSSWSCMRGRNCNEWLTGRVNSGQQIHVASSVRYFSRWGGWRTSASQAALLKHNHPSVAAAGGRGRYGGHCDFRYGKRKHRGFLTFHCLAAWRGTEARCLSLSTGIQKLGALDSEKEAQILLEFMLKLWNETKSWYQYSWPTSSQERNLSSFPIRAYI